MRPVNFLSSNTVFKGSPKGDISDLHCQREDVEHSHLSKVVWSVWKPTDEERKAIAEGDNVRVGIFTASAIPPISIDVAVHGGGAGFNEVT